MMISCLGRGGPAKHLKFKSASSKKTFDVKLIASQKKHGFKDASSTTADNGIVIESPHQQSHMPISSLP